MEWKNLKRIIIKYNLILKKEYNISEIFNIIKFIIFFKFILLEFLLYFYYLIVVFFFQNICEIFELVRLYLC